jgi:hypothetical protein
MEIIFVVQRKKFGRIDSWFKTASLLFERHIRFFLMELKHEYLKMEEDHLKMKRIKVKYQQVTDVKIQVELEKLIMRQFTFFDVKKQRILGRVNVVAVQTEKMTDSKHFEIKHQQNICLYFTCCNMQNNLISCV